MITLKEKEKYVSDLESKINKSDYESKVPENVRAQNSDKLSKAVVEISKIKESIQSLQSME